MSKNSKAAAEKTTASAEAAFHETAPRTLKVGF